MLIFSPLPKKGQNSILFHWKRSWNQRKTDRFLAKLAFFNDRFSAKFDPNFSTKFPRNRPFYPRICLWKSHEIWLFSATYQTPCVLNGLRHKSSWSGRLFLSLPLLFYMNVNNVQSWPILLKKSEGLNHTKSVKERTKCPVIQGFDRTKPFFWPVDRWPAVIWRPVIT